MDEELFDRACKAYFERFGPDAIFPDRSSSNTFEEKDGTVRVKLANVKGPLATYIYHPGSDQLVYRDPHGQPLPRGVHPQLIYVAVRFRALAGSVRFGDGKEVLRLQREIRMLSNCLEEVLGSHDAVLRGNDG